MPYWDRLPRISRVGAALRGMREARRDFVVHLQDRWNVLDVLSLVMLAGGFSVRFIDSGSPWGASSICFECPAGVFARPVLRTAISAITFTA
ncbi:unnamed protein product [Ascophyllum nodosum]